jgi:hypothetical protein
VSFLLTQTDALSPLAATAGFPRTTPGLLIASDTQACFLDLFPQLLAELAGPEGYGSAAVPSDDEATSPAFANGFGTRKTSDLQSTPEELDDQQPDAATGSAGLMNLAVPIWTASSHSLNLEETAYRLPCAAAGTLEAGQMQLSESTVPGMTAQLPSLPATAEESVDLPTAKQEGLPFPHSVPSPHSGEEQGVSEANEAEAPVPSDGMPSVESQPVSPQVPRSTIFAPPPTSERREVESLPQRRVTHLLPQGHAASPGADNDRRTSSQGERQAPEAFRLLLRNPVNIPQAELHPMSAPETTATESTGIQKASQSVPALVTKTIGEPSDRNSEGLQRVGLDRPGADQAERPASVASGAGTADRDFGDGQNGNNCQGHDEDLASGSRSLTEVGERPTTALMREGSSEAVGLRNAPKPSEANDPASTSMSTIEEPVSPTPVPRSVRELRVTLPQGGEGRGVDILLQQRAGGVEVSVRSADPQVRETLRSELSDLIGRLDRKGVTAEALPTLHTGHVTRVEQSAVLADVGVEHTISEKAVVEHTREETRDDSQQHQAKQFDWQSQSENRRRREQSAESWQKYMEENAWRSQ